MQPSFMSLFKRGRYFRVYSAPNDEHINTREHPELERFVMAAIAFCCKHSRDFAAHFFDAICRCPGDPACRSRSVLIEIEPELWGDLVLRLRKGKLDYIYVVEAKIKADFVTSAAKAWNIFKQVRHELRIQEKYTHPAIAHDNEERYFGLTLRKKNPRQVRQGDEQAMKNLVLLTKRVAPQTQDLAWFGYENVDGKDLLSVWFYCGNDRRRRALRQVLSRPYGQACGTDDEVRLGQKAKVQEQG